MIEQLYNHPHVLYQTADEDPGIAEPAIAGSVDNGGVIVLSQEGRDIIVNQGSVPDLCNLLRKLRAAAKEKKA